MRMADSQVGDQHHSRAALLVCMLLTHGHSVNGT
mgnify:CR=1 FL=1